MVRAGMPDLATLVTALITERPLCMPCLTEKTNTTPGKINRALMSIERVLGRLHRETGRCHSCGNVGEILYLDRPGG
jgi:hypothetical protein